MDGYGDQATQATQPALDPRREGKQNSGFSDDEISDVICVLHPRSRQARREVRRLATEDAALVVGKEDLEGVDDEFHLDDDASAFQMLPPDTGNYAIVLKLSSSLKDPERGFVFGRNNARCDVCFRDDPMKRLSNTHFRIYVNEYGVIMIEDQSTNGTIVDDNLLGGRDNANPHKKRLLSSGAKIKIYMHQVDLDLEFIVRIPQRAGDYDAAYRVKLNAYVDRVNAAIQQQQQQHGDTRTIVPGPTEAPNIFGAETKPRPRRTLPNGNPKNMTTQEMSLKSRDCLPRDWNGSEQYNKVATIGKGAFAVVYRVTDKFSGIPYAAKELDKRRFMKNGVLDQKVDNEMKIMQRISHPNIVRYIETLEWDERLLIIIMEFVDHGDLGKLIADQGPLDESIVRIMASQMISALNYLHENSITHRDVKPDNILISSLDPWCFKLTDFGLSKAVDNQDTFLRTFCGTLLYCAPEVYSEFNQYDLDGRRLPRNRRTRSVARQRYDHAVDIWSLGGVLFFALTQTPPYPVQQGTSYADLLNQIMTTNLNTRPLINAGVSHNCIDFLKLMLQRRPELRATGEQLVEHAWLGGSGLSQQPGFRDVLDEESLDEVTDDELEANASQLSLGGQRQQRQVDDIDQLDFALDRDDMMQDADDGDSEKENQASRPKTGPRLFGEVNVSAIGSSGVIAEDRLNLPVSQANSLQQTIILGSDRESEIPDSFESDHFTPNRRSQPNGGARLSVGPQNQSLDQLQSLVHNVASQSLGGSSPLGGVSVRSSSDSRIVQLAEFNASKRKPMVDTSDEFDDVQGKKPTFKRLKSENNVEPLGEDVALEELMLLSSIPGIQRLQSGRQIDNPVHKTVFWDRRDDKTYHVDYPEMTQLQLDVFRQAAREKGHEFEPGKSGLWKVAMKYFPPTNWKGSDVWALVELGADDEEGHAPDSVPDTLPSGSQQVMVADDLGQNRLAAVLESPLDSLVKDVHLPVDGPILSWGRGVENTHVLGRRNESMVPKYAFKILLWKEGYDAARDRGTHPWNQNGRTDEDEFHFYISTKATNGIWINDYMLQSHDSKKPLSPSHYWVRLHHGDDLIVWSSDRLGQAKLTFKCFWGGSRLERDEAESPPQPVYVGMARRLDDICLKAEKRYKSDAVYKAALDVACKEHELRERFIDRERARSDDFEKTRQEAINVLAQRNASSKASPSSLHSSGVRLG